MRRNKLLFVLLLAAPLWGAETPPDPMEALAAAYRAGRPAEALDRAADVLEADPKNRDARHYLWTIGRQVKESDKAGTLSPGEREDILRLAESDLERRRHETEETLERLRDSYEKSRRIRSPQDVLAGAEGMGRYLRETFQEERQQALADGYFRGLVENLTTALKTKTFVTQKDALVAQAWLAYYGGERKRALNFWEAAAAADPSDREVANNLDQLRRLLQREADEKQISAWESQAVTYQDTGFDKEALELWQKILTKAPDRADVKRQADKCAAALKDGEKRARLAAMTEEGVRLYREGKPLDAAQAWFRVLEQDPSHREARVWLTHVGRQLGAMEAPPLPAPASPADPRPAAGQANHGAALDLYKQGLVAYSQDHVAGAVDLWEKALDQDPSLTQAREALRQAQAELSFKKNAAK